MWWRRWAGSIPALKHTKLLALTDERRVVTTPHTPEDAVFNAEAFLDSLKLLFERRVRVSEIVEYGVNPIRSTRDIIVGSVRVHDGESVRILHRTWLVDFVKVSVRVHDDAGSAQIELVTIEIEELE